MLLQAENVTHEFERPAGHAPLRVLDQVSFELDQGQSLAIVGPSGSGKSTLLNLVGGLDQPTSGCVHFDGTELATLDDKALAAFRNQDVGFVFQLHHLLPQCTVLENVLVPAMATGKPSAQTVARATELLDRVGLAEFAESWPAQLSGGERQRVAVVRALINRPRLLLADEPTGALDAETGEKLVELLLELQKADDVALIVVTHAPQLARRMDTAMTLQNGALSPIGEDK